MAWEGRYFYISLRHRILLRETLIFILSKKQLDVWNPDLRTLMMIGWACSESETVRNHHYSLARMYILFIFDILKANMIQLYLWVFNFRGQLFGFSQILDFFFFFFLQHWYSYPQVLEVNSNDTKVNSNDTRHFQALVGIKRALWRYARLEAFPLHCIHSFHELALHVNTIYNAESLKLTGHHNVVHVLVRTAISLA